MIVDVVVRGQSSHRVLPLGQGHRLDSRAQLQEAQLIRTADG